MVEVDHDHQVCAHSTVRIIPSRCSGRRSRILLNIVCMRTVEACGKLKKNFPAKTIARVHQRTYVVVCLNTNASSQMSTWGDGLEGRDRSIEANGSGTNALSQMSTCWDRSQWRDESLRQIWRECPLVDVNASRKAPGYKGSRGYL